MTTGKCHFLRAALTYPNLPLRYDLVGEALGATLESMDERAFDPGKVVEALAEQAPDDESRNGLRTLTEILTIFERNGFKQTDKLEFDVTTQRPGSSG